MVDLGAAVGGAPSRSAEARLGAKLIRWLVAPLALLTFVNAIDRANISFAGHAMSLDLGLTPSAFGAGVSAFFVAYLIFQYPHAALLRRVGMRWWLLVTVTLWGVAGVWMSQVHSAPELMAARFLLGVAEAGFGPGVTWTINRWVPHQARAKAMATALAAVPFALVVGGPLCGWMLGIGNPFGLAPWRWMFLLQALPTFAVAIASFVYFRDDLAASSWLSADERAQLVPAPEAPAGEALREALGDPRVWRCALFWLFSMTGAYALLFWLPQLVRQMDLGGTEFLIGAISALPQVGLVAGMLLNAWLSDRADERQWHVAVPSVLGGLALAAGVLSPPGWASLGWLVAASAGMGAAQAVFWSAPARMGVGGGKISVTAVAFISMFGTAGGIVGPMLVAEVKQATGGYVGSLLVLAALLVLAGLIFAPWRRRLARP